MLRATIAAGATVVGFAGFVSGAPVAAIAEEKIAFQRSGINTVNKDGSGSTRVTTDSHDRLPVWSPDQATLAFERDIETGTDWRGDAIHRHDLYLVSAGGDQARELARDAVDPSWSPDGRTIVFERYSKETLWTIDVDGTQLRRVGTGIDPAWAPSGREIVFVGPSGRVTIMNADGSGKRPLHTVSTTGRAAQPAWSPSGGQIAFRGNHSVIGSVRIPLYVVDTSKRRVSKLVERSASYDLAGPKWSPDGRSILFEKDSSTPSRLRDDLHVMDLRTRKLRLLALDTSGADWSPDGTRVVFVRRGLRVMVLTGGASTTRLIGSGGSPDWLSG